MVRIGMGSTAERMRKKMGRPRGSERGRRWVIQEDRMRKKMGRPRGANEEEDGKWGCGFSREGCRRRRLWMQEKEGGGRSWVQEEGGARHHGHGREEVVGAREGGRSHACRLTAKADVYSFGVVLLELLSGRRALDKNKIGIEQNLADWARPYLGDKRKLFLIMDSRLEGQYPKKGAHIVAILALQCISKEPKLRPKMSEVLATLEPLQDSKGMMKEIQRGQIKKLEPMTPKSPMRHAPSPMRPSPKMRE